MALMQRKEYKKDEEKQPLFSDLQMKRSMLWERAKRDNKLDKSLNCDLVAGVALLVNLRDQGEIRNLQLLW